MILRASFCRSRIERRTFLAKSSLLVTAMRPTVSAFRCFQTNAAVVRSDADGGKKNKHNFAPSVCTKALTFFARGAEPRSTIKKILRAAPLIRRFRNSMKTSALTLPLSMLMNRRWPREVTAEIRLMPWRAPVAWTMGVSPFAPHVRPAWIGADVRRVAEIDVRPLFFGHRLDLRVFFLEPLPNQRLVAFDRAMQWLLTSDA